MRKTILLACFMLSAMAQGIMADNEYNYLTVTRASGEESISLPTIQKITFAEGNVVVTTATGNYTYPLAEMQKMAFTANASAIKALPGKADGLKFKGGELNVSGNGILHIYDAKGTLLQMANVEKGANISLKNLPKGVYIVNMGDQTIKIRK